MDVGQVKEERKRKNKTCTAGLKQRDCELVEMSIGKID